MNMHAVEQAPHKLAPPSLRGMLAENRTYALDGVGTSLYVTTGIFHHGYMHVILISDSDSDGVIWRKGEVQTYFN